jgi:XTP/dITP diphosphohydrolase
MEVLIGTSNKGKFKEILEVLGVLPYKFLSPEDLNIEHACEECGETYEENSLIKANYYHEKSGLLTVAEDSGIIVDALQSSLGVQTRRWGAGGNASDEEWIKYFLEVMKDVPDKNRTARFVCCSAVVSKDNDAKIFVGETEGVITRELQAPIIKGLPLSSCFIPDGFQEVYAGLTVNQKNQVSHRGKAMRQVYEYLMVIGRE